MMTPTLVGLAPCTRSLTRQRAAPRWGRWGGRRGWCCSAARAGACTWLAAAPQCSFWERHTHTHTVPVSGERAAPNTSGFTPLCLSAVYSLLQLQRCRWGFGKGRTGRWLTGEWLGGMQRCGKKHSGLYWKHKHFLEFLCKIQTEIRAQYEVWDVCVSVCGMLSEMHYLVS